MNPLHLQNTNTYLQPDGDHQINNEAYKNMMLERLRAVKLNTPRFEELITLPKNVLFHKIAKNELRQLLTVLDKKDVISNLRFNENEYNWIDGVLGIQNEKKRLIFPFPERRSIEFHLEESYLKSQGPLVYSITRNKYSSVAKI